MFQDPRLSISVEQLDGLSAYSHRIDPVRYSAYGHFVSYTSTGINSPFFVIDVCTLPPYRRRIDAGSAMPHQHPV
jgi:hypothetical protein